MTTQASKIKDLHKRLNADLERGEKRKEICLGTSGYVHLVLQQNELLKRCLQDIYWASYD